MGAEQVKKRLRRRRRETAVVDADYLSTGSTLVNLACTGDPYGGFVKGHYFFIVGDSASGKTFLVFTCLAEANINPAFADYRFVYDGPEDGALMDIPHFFGQGVANRVELPPTGISTTIEEFYYNVDDVLSTSIPAIYILDSMDVLSSEDEGRKFEETKTAYRKGKAAAGSYGDGKAKKNSANLRKVIPRLKETGSILIIVNQTRDNLGFGFETKTRSGGHALRFYATIEMWSSISGRLKRRVRGAERQLGIRAKVRLKKNRLSGREREVELPIYYSYGIDDIGSCVDWLVAEGHWKKAEKGARVTAEEYDFTGTREGLVKYIEEEELEADLRGIVKEVWDEIEAACAVKRKRRYE